MVSIFLRVASFLYDSILLSSPAPFILVFPNHSNFCFVCAYYNKPVLQFQIEPSATHGASGRVTMSSEQQAHAPRERSAICPSLTLICQPEGRTRREKNEENFLLLLSSLHQYYASSSFFLFI